MKMQLLSIIIFVTILLVACGPVPTPDIPPLTQPVMDTSTPPTFTASPSPIPSETPEPTETASQMPSATFSPSETATMEPTTTPTPTPSCIPVAITTNLVGWKPNFDASNGNLSLNEIKLNQVEGVIELDYDVGSDGYSIITHSIDPKVLSGADGISFLYKGKGAPNSIEFKLLLNYPGLEDTTFGKTFDRATDTADQWLQVIVPFSEIECWWPAENCAMHGDSLDFTKIDRMDFVVKNNRGDKPGSGWVLFKDICVSQP